MGYDKFSAKNAYYFARYGLHMKNSVSPEEIYGGSNRTVDAVVLEIRGSEVWVSGSILETFKKLLKGRVQVEDYDVVKYCEKKGIPVYVTGHDMTRKNYVLFWVTVMLTIFLAPITFPILLIAFGVLLYTVPGKKRRVAKAASFLMAVDFMLGQSMGGAGANALCAKKTEEYIAVKLRKKLGRRPRIGLNYGLAHMGVRVDFQHPKFRNFNLFILKYFNFEFWREWGSYRGKMGKIYEANFNKKSRRWDVESHETHFFDN